MSNGPTSKATAQQQIKVEPQPSQINSQIFMKTLIMVRIVGDATRLIDKIVNKINQKIYGMDLADIESERAGVPGMD